MTDNRDLTRAILWGYLGTLFYASNIVILVKYLLLVPN